MIPEFEDCSGYLPDGVHNATWEEFYSRFGFNLARVHQLDGLLKALQHVRAAGCSAAIIDGSFVTTIDFPNDYDALWDVRNVNIALVDPILLDPKKYRQAIKVKYRGDLFPLIFGSAPFDHFVDFFRKDRDGVSKGVVQLEIGTLP